MKKFVSLFLVCILLLGSLPSAFADAIERVTPSELTPGAAIDPLSPEPTETPLPGQTNTPAPIESHAPETDETPLGQGDAFFGKGVFYNVNVFCEPSQAGREAVVVLQRKIGEEFAPVLDPNDPLKEYELTVTIDQSGWGFGQFELEGLPADAEYRTWLVSYAGTPATDQSRWFTESYADGNIEERATAITITVTNPLPTPEPDGEPTVEPTIEPTAEPTVEPTIEPTAEPTAEPTIEPTVEPTVEPTIEPTAEPTIEPTVEPTAEPTIEPTVEPTAKPSVEPGFGKFDGSSAMMKMTAPMALAATKASPVQTTLHFNIRCYGNVAEEEEFQISFEYKLSAGEDGADAACTILDTAYATVTVADTTPDSATISVVPTNTYLKNTATFSVEVTLDGACVVTAHVNEEGENASRLVREDSPYDTGDGLLYTVDFTRLASFSATVNWNDNKSPLRPADSTPTLERYVGGVWTSDDVSQEHVAETLSSSNILYTYSGLDAFDEEDQAVQYRVVQDAVDGYITTYHDEGKTIRNTLMTSLTVHKQWNDISHTDMRPSFDDWFAKVKLFGSGGEAGTDISLTGSAIQTAYIVSPDTDVAPVVPPVPDVWTITVSGLPAYTPSGYPYLYRVTDGVSDAPVSGNKYASAYENVGDYAEKTDGAYTDGSLISTMQATTKFQFTKYWADGDLDSAQRPTVNFYLYRFADKSGLSFDNGSPVPLMDTMECPNTQSDGLITYSVNGVSDLPKYDEIGREYIYFATEKIPVNTHDYVTHIANVESAYSVEAGTSYILAGATVTNRSEATVEPAVTKTWQAQSIQGMDATVTVQLVRWPLSKPGSTYTEARPESITAENSGLYTIEGFTAERMTQTYTFPKMPKYDAEGYEYVYKVLEVGATVNKDVAVVDEKDEGDPFVHNDVFTADGHKFVVLYGEDGTIINRLIGDTSFRIVKQWRKSGVAGSSLFVPASITVRVYRNGAPYTDLQEANCSLAEAGSASGYEFQTDHSDIQLTGTGDYSLLLVGLPRYTDEGGEYAYTVEEVTKSISVEQDGATDVYTFNSLVYSMPDGVRTATITNVIGTGRTMVFNISKSWLDDGDLTHRVPVKAGVYYTGPDSNEEELVAEAILTAEGSWRASPNYTPASDVADVAERWEYEYYSVREMTNEGYMTVSEDGLSAETDEHLYVVSVASGTPAINDYIITNLRVGTLTITIKKEWRVGAETNLQSTFGLVRNNEMLPYTRTITQGGEDATFTNLEKYDDKEGKIISYQVVETHIGQDGYMQSFTNDVASFMGRRMVSKLLGTTYTVGEQHTDDTMEVRFRNRFEESAELVVNKVWRDMGTANSIRPDISFTLTRQSEKPGSLVTKVPADRIWNTKQNDWFWRCSFGQMDVYDEYGYPYKYFVTETIGQPTSPYTASYYDGFSQPRSDGVDSENVFRVQDGETATGPAIARFVRSKERIAAGPGTIINSLQKTRDFSGSKLWLNLPKWFKETDLPTVSIQLYRVLTSQYETVTEKFADTYKVYLEDGETPYSIELKKGQSDFTFTDLDTYDQYGRPYTYYIREENSAGTPFALNGYAAASTVGSTITNTYNEYGKTITVKATKEWDWSLREKRKQTTYPAITLELYQIWDPDGVAPANRELLVASQTLAGGTIPDSNTVTLTHTFTADKSGKALPLYAPDGSTYTYAVREKTLNGYTTTVTPIVMPVSPTEAVTELATTVKNVYAAESIEVSFTITWDDQEDLYGTRPDFDRFATFYVELYRKTKSGDASSVPVNAWMKTVVDPQADYVWKTTVMGPDDTKRYKYDTNGEAYTYWIDPQLTVGAPDYTLTKGENTLDQTYSLTTVPVEANLQWQDINKTALDANALADFGDMRDIYYMYMRFGIEYSDDAGNTWKDVVDPSEPNKPLERDIRWNDIVEAEQAGQNLTVFTGLPRYIPNSDPLTVRQYRISTAEAFMRDGTDPLAIFESNTLPSAPGEGSVNDITFVFNFDTRKLYFAVNWDDDVNRDGARFESVKFHIFGVPGSAVLALSKDTRISAVEPPATHTLPTNGTRYVGEMTVPVGEVTVALNDSPELENGYKSSEVTNSGDWYSVTLSRAPKKIRIVAKKDWEDRDNVYGDRPTSVAFVLRRQDANG